MAQAWLRFIERQRCGDRIPAVHHRKPVGIVGQFVVVAKGGVVPLNVTQPFSYNNARKPYVRRRRQRLPVLFRTSGQRLGRYQEFGLPIGQVAAMHDLSMTARSMPARAYRTTAAAWYPVSPSCAARHVVRSSGVPRAAPFTTDLFTANPAASAGR